MESLKPFDYNSIKTHWLYCILESLKISKDYIQKTSNWEKLNLEPAQPGNSEREKKFYEERCLHILAMLIMGVIGEILIKLILLKEDYIINEIKSIKIIDFKPNIEFSENTISFFRAVEQFKKNLSKKKNYFDGLEGYKLCLKEENYDYFGFKEINPDNCLDLLIKIRNNYAHLALPKKEKRGIVWYIYNFLIFLIKKEFSDEKNILNNYDLNFIGDEEVLKCFEK